MNYNQLFNKAKRNNFEDLDDVLNELEKDTSDEALEILIWIALNAKMPASTLVMGSDRRSSARAKIARNFEGKKAADALIKTAPPNHSFNLQNKRCERENYDEQRLQKQAVDFFIQDNEEHVEKEVDTKEKTKDDLNKEPDVETVLQNDISKDDDFIKTTQSVAEMPLEPQKPQIDTESVVVPDSQKNCKTKKNKIGLIVGLIVTAIILIGAGGYWILRSNAPEPIVDNLLLSVDTVEYNGNIMIEVEYSNESRWEERAEFPISLNGELLFKNIMDIEPKTSFKKEYYLTDLPDGEYTVEIADKKEVFVVKTPAMFEARLENKPEFFIAGRNYQVDYIIENVGQSKGEYTLKHIFNGQNVIGETIEMDGNTTHDAVINIFVNENDKGSITYGLADDIVESRIYTPTELEHGKKLMDNTVKGYGYILIENHSRNDAIIYITEASNDDKAVGAVCVGAGKEYKFYSFPHGTYHLFIQTGEDWIDELNCFATDEVIRQNKTDLVFKNNVSKMYGGTYTYWTIPIFDDVGTTGYYKDVDSLPNILTK